MRMKISKLLGNKAFLVGFFTGFSLLLFYHFLGLIFIFGVERNSLFHEIRYLGFPFTIYEMSDYIGGSFFLLELIWNLIFAIVFSFLIGLIFKFAWSKISARKLI